MAIKQNKEKWTFCARFAILLFESVIVLVCIWLQFKLEIIQECDGYWTVWTQIYSSCSNFSVIRICGYPKLHFEGQKLLYQRTEIISKWFKLGACLELTVDYFRQFLCYCHCCMCLILICSLDWNTLQIVWQSFPAVSFTIMDISTELFNIL